MSNNSRTGEPAIADLRIYVLGPSRIEWLGRPLPVVRRQARALLFYLAAQRQAAPRESLHFLFWPDTRETIARRNLTRLLTHLRRALPASEILLSAGDGIRLDPLRYWCDLVEFGQLCAIQDPHSRCAALRRAVSLWRGRFLAGFSLPECCEFEAWSLQEQTTQERIYLEALDALMEDCAARGAWDEALAHAQRYLETDDLAEKVHRRCIEFYAASGNRSEALRQFERCATILERDLGVSPLPQTRAVYEAVLSGGTAAAQVLPPPEWTTIPSLVAPLIGRDDALARLRLAYIQARLGHGGMVLVSGEPGIGKSRLVQEFVTGLQGEATVMVTSCHDGEQGLPYGPLVEALRPHGQALSQGMLHIAPVQVAQMVRLLPELCTLLPDVPVPSLAEPGQDQGSLFRTLTHCLASLAARHPPLILCIDDLHWADEATLSWLGYLCRRLQTTSILALGTCRTEQTATMAPLRAQLARNGPVHEITLGGLTQADVLDLIRHLSGQTTGAERFSQRLHRETGGNPFFLLETLRAMFDARLLWLDETGWSTAVDEATEDYRELPLPDSIHQAIRDRVGRLSSEARQVLEAGAVIGHRFGFDLVQQTSGRREDEAVDGLEMLTARQILSVSSGTYEFNHDLIRAVVYRDLSYGRRRLLHRRAAQALVTLRSKDRAALARHFERAEEPEKAAEVSRQANG